MVLILFDLNRSDPIVVIPVGNAIDDILFQANVQKLSKIRFSTLSGMVTEVI